MTGGIVTGYSDSPELSSSAESSLVNSPKSEMWKSFFSGATPTSISSMIEGDSTGSLTGDTTPSGLN